MDPEELVIGGCLLSNNGIRFAAEALHPEDFHDRRHEGLFRAIVQLHKSGQPVEPYTVVTKSQVKGITVPDLLVWMENVGTSISVQFYAAEVKENATRRRMNLAGSKYMQHINDLSVPPAKAMEEMLADLRTISDDSIRKTARAKTLGELLAIEDSPEDWVIEDLFERGDRMIITGHEGLGKTTWIRQIAICAAAGINPITLDNIAPVVGLVFDVENSEKQWRREVKGMTKLAARHGEHDPEKNLFVECHQRVDIRRDKDLGFVHRLVDEHNPEILFIGPIYKMVPNGINSDEEAAPVIAALDTLRDRGLVLVMEAHAPKGNGSENRNLAPRGSAALMGWPEFGFGLEPSPDGANIQRWRGDRDRDRLWPHKLQKGGPFPWTADNVAPGYQKFYGWEKTA